MKTKWIFAALVIITGTAFADDVKVTLEGGGGINGTFSVTTNETSCGRLNWDGVPDKSGAMSGGQYEITLQMVSDEVVLKERTLAAHKGIRSDITAKTIVPIDRIPWTGKVSQTTVTVFRSDPKKKETRSPNKILHGIDASAPNREN